MKIEALIIDQQAVEAPDGNIWIDVDKSRYLNGAEQPIVDEAPVISENLKIGKFRIQGVNLGQADSIFESEPISEMQRSLKVLTLSERIALPNHPLIRKRYLVNRNMPDPAISDENSNLS